MVVSIIIPALDLKHIPDLTVHIQKSLVCPHEILVQQEKGFVNAVLSGLDRAQGNVVVIMDSDGSHDPAHLPAMLKILKYGDIVIGSRYAPGGNTEDLIIRRVVSRFFCKVARSLLRLDNVSDVMSGYIVVRKEVFRTIKLSSVGYKVGLDILLQARGRFRILECPICFQKSKKGDFVKPSSIKQGLKTLAFIFKLFVKESVKSHGGQDNRKGRVLV